jgi:hypothetical protein
MQKKTKLRPMHGFGSFICISEVTKEEEEENLFRFLKTRAHKDLHIYKQR